jgi:transcriptional regulator with XRE-family HTH domain
MLECCHKIPYMDYQSKRTLWLSLERLMEARYGGSNINKLSRESGVGLGTVARLKSNKSSVALDKVDKLAAVFGVEPWQLLMPNFGPDAQEESFSPLATDIARAIDRIEDPEAQQRAYALALQVVGLATAPVSSSPAPVPTPTLAPVPHP